MSIQEPIEPSLQQKFQAEKLLRIIQDCEDLEILREIAIELLKLNQKKTAIAECQLEEHGKLNRLNLKKSSESTFFRMMSFIF